MNLPASYCIFRRSWDARTQPACVLCGLSWSCVYVRQSWSLVTSAHAQRTWRTRVPRSRPSDLYHSVQLPGCCGPVDKGAVTPRCSPQQRRQGVALPWRRYYYLLQAHGDTAVHRGAGQFCRKTSTRLYSYRYDDKWSAVMTSNFQVIGSFLIQKYENSSQGHRSKVKVRCHQTLSTSAVCHNKHSYQVAIIFNQ